MKVSVGEHHYDECGLPYVYLQNVPIAKCKSCGESTVGIPRIEELHRVIAESVALSAPRLGAAEIRFLRTHLGWSGKECADKMGVVPETVSRWENGHSEPELGHERLLRLVVLLSNNDRARDASILGTMAVEARREPKRLPISNASVNRVSKWLAELGPAL